MTLLSPQKFEIFSDGLKGTRLRWAAYSIYIGMICSTLDMAILQNALPTLTRELHVSSADSVWIITLYMLVMLILLLPFAPLSDKIGYRRTYLVGFMVFTVASLGCGLSVNLVELQIGRVLQGIGAAAMTCTTTSLIRLIYSKEMMAKAIGGNATVVAVSLAAAPSISALIMSRLSWHWLFWINVPLGLIAMFLGWKSLPGSPGQMAPPSSISGRLAWRGAFTSVDWWSVLVSVGFFGLLLVGTDVIVHAPVPGVAMLAVAGGFCALFVRRQVRDPHPMLPFDLLGERNYALAIATSFGSFAAQGAAFVALPFFLQRSASMDMKHAAVILTAWPLALALAAQVSARLQSRVSTEKLCAIGQAMTATGLALVASKLLPGTLTTYVCLLALSGAGFGLFQAPNNYLIVSAAPPLRSGSVGALRAATRTAGQLLGSALCGLAFLVGAVFHMRDGSTIGIWMAAAMALGASLFSLSRKVLVEGSR